MAYLKAVPVAAIVAANEGKGWLSNTINDLFGGKLIWGRTQEEFNNRWQNATWWRFLGMDGYWDSADGRKDLNAHYPGLDKNEAFYRHFGMRFSLWEPGLENIRPYFLFDPNNPGRLPQTQYTQSQVADIVKTQWQGNRGAVDKIIDQIPTTSGLGNLGMMIALGTAAIFLFADKKKGKR